MGLKKIIHSKINFTGLKKVDMTIAVKEIETVIQNYCNIDKIPDALNYTWANMVVDLLNYRYQVLNPDTGGGDSDIADIDISGANSIKVGDTDIKIGTSEKTKRANKILDGHSADLDSIVLNHQDQLNQFRRIVW